MRKQMNDVTIKKEQRLLIEDTAAEWLLLLEECPTKDNQAALTHWLNESKQHQIVYQKMKQAWTNSDMLTEEDILQPHERVNLLSKQKPSNSTFFNRFFWPTTLLSCTLALVVVSVLPFTSTNHNNSPLHQDELTVNAESYKTNIGETKQITLADKSILALASGSEVSVNYTAKKRNIELLKGEALFSVTTDKTRPFIVTYRGRIAQALGTAFNVKESQGNMHIQVLEGTVKVASIANSQLFNKVLNAGQGIAITQNGSMSDVLKHTNREKMDWQKGRLSYVNVSLASVIYDISRYVPLHIYIQDKSVADMRFTGNIKLDSIEQWFTDLPDIFPLNIQQYGDTKVMTKRE